MKKIKDMSNKELEDELISTTEMIETCGYGTKDLLWQRELENEISNRGGDIIQTVRVIWNEVEENE